MLKTDYTHYGKQVSYHLVSDNAVLEQLQEQKIKYQILPIVDLRYKVYAYEKGDGTKYAVTVSNEDATFLLDELPIDFDLDALYLDIKRQKDGEEPGKMRTFLSKIIEEFYSKFGALAYNDTEQFFEDLKIYLLNYNLGNEVLTDLEWWDVNDEFLQKLIET